MRGKSLSCVLAVALVATGAASIWMLAVAGNDEWDIEADIAETCSCNPACPCVFGSPSTSGTCEGSRLVEIEKGHFGDVNLDGISVVVTFRMGGFAKYYVTDAATDEQVEAAEKLISAAFPPFAAWGLLGTKKVPMKVEWTDERVKFSVPESTVDMKVMQGLNGKPIKVDNLPAPFLTDYTQFVSVRNSHSGGEHSFEYSGKNGFTSRLD